MTENVNELLSAMSVWNGFAIDEQLKESYTNKITYDGITYSDVYFDGRDVDGERVRIYGSLATPMSESKGGILIIPDLDDTNVSEIVGTYAKLGFTVLAVDYYGCRDDRDKFTVYPESVDFANYLKSGEKFFSAPDGAKRTCWYEWTAVCHYAVRFLKKCAGVNKVGVFGIKTGSHVAWQLTATSNEVDAFIGAYGAGWVSGNSLTDESRVFVAGVEAQSYAPYVKCPVLFLTSTNSEEFDIDKSMETLSRTKSKKVYLNITPRIGSRLGRSCLRDSEMFFRKYLLGEDIKLYGCPEVSLSQEGDELSVKTEFEDASNLKSYKVYVSQDIRTPAHRFWVKLADNEKPKTESVTDVFRLDKGVDTVDVFVVAKYENGFSVCSKIVDKKITVEGNFTEHVLFSGNSSDGYFAKFGIEDGVIGNLFYTDDLHTETVKGPHGIKGVLCSGEGIISYVIGKKSFVITDGSLLKFDVYTKDFCPLKITLAYYDGQYKSYEYNCDVKGLDDWQNLLICISDFKSNQNMTIKDYDGIYAITFSSDSEFVLNNILLI